MTLNEYQQHALETAIYPENRRITVSSACC